MPVEFRSGTASGPAGDQRLAGPGQDVYETLAMPLFDYCAGLLGDEVAATDAVQDSLIAVDAQTGRPPEPGPLRVPLYFAARRQCLSRRPGRRLTPVVATGPAGPAGTAADQLGAATPDAPDARPPRAVGETLPIVTAALARLPDRDREVLSLAFRHGMPAAELAAVLGLSPRRARWRLSRASDRFRKSAALAVVLRAGWLGCYVLARIAGQRDPAPPPPLASKLGRRLDCHVASCPACARTLGHRAVDPGLISQVPLVAPAGQLRLRIIRTAHAQGSYRGQADSFTSGDVPAPAVRPRGVRRAMVASSAVLAVLAALGVLLYRHESTPAASPRPTAAKAALGIRSAAPARPSRPGELPGLPALGAPVLGVLPGPSHTPWPWPRHANPSPTPVPTPIPDPRPPSPVT